MGEMLVEDGWITRVILVALTFWPLSGRAGGLSDTPTMLVQRGDVMTATASASTKVFACELSISQARRLCQIRKFNDIGKVKCDCSQEKLPDRWECIGTATCQEN